MATYRVVPLPDGTTLRGSWQVKKDGQRISKHRLKRAAERKARSEAGPNDRVEVHGTDGRIQGTRPNTQAQSRESEPGSMLDKGFGIDGALRPQTGGMDDDVLDADPLDVEGASRDSGGEVGLADGDEKAIDKLVLDKNTELDALDTLDL